VSFDDSKYVWKNGSLVPWSEATFHVSCHGINYGTGVFEGIRCYATETGPVVFRLYEHVDRWLASAKVYGMEIPYTREQLAQAMLEVVSANEFESCYLRPLAIFGSKTLTLHPRNNPVEVVIFGWKWEKYLGADAADHGAHVTVSDWRKFSSTSMPATAKTCGQYVNSVLAVRDAVARGFDEALLLDSEGFLTEGSGENLFLVKGGRLFTNDERSSVLMGITRDSVIQLARDSGLEVEIERLSMPQLLGADEVFLTGTAVELMPVTKIDGRPVKNGKAGGVTAQLHRKFVEVTTGKDPRYASWLTYAPALVPENGSQESLQWQ